MIQGWLFEIRCERLLIGERVKMGIFRPCVKTIPCSTISHSLQETTGIPKIRATGFLSEDRTEGRSNIPERLVITSRDAATDNVKVPITIEFLSNVIAHILILASPSLSHFQDLMDRIPGRRFTMGGLRSKGFGDCSIRFLRPLGKGDTETAKGVLKTRIYEDWCSLFEISPIRERYGYLYRPDSTDRYGKSGAYYRSLFDGSLVEAPAILCSTNEEGQNE